MPKEHKNVVFGIRVENELLYDTIAPNPRKTLRAYKKLKRKDEDAQFAEFEMRRRKEMPAVKETYIGPMR